MITSTKNYTEKNKKQKKPDRQKPRTVGKSKSIQTKPLKEAYTYTLTNRDKEEIYIYIYIFLKKEESTQVNKQTYQ